MKTTTKTNKDDADFWKAVRTFFEALATSPRRRIAKLARETSRRLNLRE